jgi:hypothetical protein
LVLLLINAWVTRYPFNDLWFNGLQLELE